MSLLGIPDKAIMVVYTCKNCGKVSTEVYETGNIIDEPGDKICPHCEVKGRLSIYNKQPMSRRNFYELPHLAGVGDYVLVENPWPLYGEYEGEVVQKKGRKLTIKYEKNGELKYCIARKISDPYTSALVMYWWKRDIEYNENRTNT